jgi:hypothetical protein
MRGFVNWNSIDLTRFRAENEKHLYLAVPEAFVRIPARRSFGITTNEVISLVRPEGDEYLMTATHQLSQDRRLSAEADVNRM